MRLMKFVAIVILVIEVILAGWMLLCTIRLIRFLRKPVALGGSERDLIAAKIVPPITFRTFRNTQIFLLVSIAMFAGLEIATGSEMSSVFEAFCFASVLSFLASSTGLWMRVKDDKLMRSQLQNEHAVFSRHNLEPATLCPGRRFRFWLWKLRLAKLKNGEKTWTLYADQNETEISGYIFSFPAAGSFFVSKARRRGFVTDLDFAKLADPTSYNSARASLFRG